MTHHHILAALRNRSFLFLWLAEIFSQVAMNMLNFILIIVAYQLTQSNAAVSGIVLAFTIPAVVFGLLAGVLVDRWDKKKVLFLTNFFRACLLLLLAFFYKEISLLYILTFAVSIITQFFIPAETPVIPLVIKKELLYSANALFGIALYGAVLIAYGLSGPFLLWFDPMVSLFILAMIFFVASLCVYFIREPKLAVKETNISASVRQELHASFSLILRTKEVYSSFILLTVIQILILMISILGPAYAKDILGVGIEQFPILFVTPAAVGMVVGALLLTHFFHQHPKHKSARIGLFIAAGAVYLLPYLSGIGERYLLAGVIVVSFIIGLALSLIVVPSNTIIQEKTSDTMRGKIYGTLNAVVSFASILPVILVGSLADVFGVGAVLTVVGVIVGIIGILHGVMHR